MFRRVLPEDAPAITAAPAKVRKLLLCTGKVYYDLLKHREDIGCKDVAIARLEQVAPFPVSRGGGGRGMPRARRADTHHTLARADRQ